MKKALITGIRGQDGAYLAEFLLNRGYEVIGADRRTSETGWRLEELGIKGRIKTVYMDLLEYANVLEVINAVKPDEVYNLAAQSHVHVSFTQPLVTSHINALGPLMLLEAVRRFSPHSRFYQASTSEMFGSSPPPQDENTPLPAKEPLCRLKTLRTLDDDKL